MSSAVTGPDQPTAGLIGRIAIAILSFVGGLLFQLRWKGLKNMPATGPVIIAVNHLSHIDTILIARLVWDSGRVPRFMAKSSLWDVPVVGTVMRRTEQIPVTRYSTEAADSLNAVVAALHRNEAVVIYPEGTTSKDPQHWPMHPKTGMARLVLLEPSVPVVPVWQWGAQQREPGERKWRRRVTAVVGTPMDMSQWAAASPSASSDTATRPPSVGAASQETLEAIGTEIMTVIRSGVGDLRGETPPQTVFRLPKKTTGPAQESLTDNDFSS